MISVAIIAKNSQHSLDKCLSSVFNLTNNIVVVIDKTTTDKTEDLASKYGAKVFYRDFDNFANQKNFAVSKVSNDWVFSLDADEYSSPILNAEMLKAVQDSQIIGYKIPRLNIIFGKPIYHTNWGPRDDTHIWLFNKKYCHWQGQVHEEVICEGIVGKLSNYKLHDSYRTVEDFISKLNTYTSREAKVGRLYSNPFYDFLRRYVWHKGFLDGWHGLFLSYLMMIYHTTIWVKKSYLSRS